MENLVLSQSKRIAFFTDKFPLISGITTIAFGNTQLNGQNETELNKGLASLMKVKHFAKIKPEHSDRVEIIENQNYFKNYYDCDALVYFRNTACWPYFHPILLSNTADCPTILITDPKLKIAGIIHSGWKGTQKNIVQATLEKIYDRHPLYEDLIAFLWPGICETCYEVGSEMEKNFPGKIKNGHLNLKKIIHEQLEAGGVKTIYSTNVCPSCWQEKKKYLFHSHRREHNGKRNCVFLST